MEIDLTKLTPDVRKLNDMGEVLADPACKAKNFPDTDLYFMYRGVEQKNGLRYDITIIPAKTLGFEFVKTKGHYHLENWQEVYTVLKGTAIYLLQKKNLDGEIDDVYAVTAKENESIIIPPSYGHVTINPSETEELKMANWISPDCKVDYLSYEKFQGACYYYTQSGWIKNENYKNAPKLRFEKPLKSLPENLDFLKKN
jgi:glucose-6-phosphate isomerase